jgi:hypothetical protein
LSELFFCVEHGKVCGLVPLITTEEGRGRVEMPTDWDETILRFMVEDWAQEDEHLPSIKRVEAHLINLRSIAHELSTACNNNTPLTRDDLCNISTALYGISKRLYEHIPGISIPLALWESFGEGECGEVKH